MIYIINYQTYTYTHTHLGLTSEAHALSTGVGVGDVLEVAGVGLHDHGASTLGLSHPTFGHLVLPRQHHGRRGVLVGAANVTRLHAPHRAAIRVCVERGRRHEIGISQVGIEAVRVWVCYQAGMKALCVE